MATRRTYTNKFKREAVDLAKANGFTQTGRDLDVNPNLLHKWRKALDEDQAQAFPGNGTPRDVQLAEVQRENARLREENAILKKAVSIFSSRPR